MKKTEIENATTEIVLDVLSEAIEEKKIEASEKIEEIKQDETIPEPEKKEIIQEVKEETKKEIEVINEKFTEKIEELKTEVSKPKEKKSNDFDSIIWLVVIILLIVIGYYLYKFFSNGTTNKNEIQTA
jgi:hypothetical protein